MCKFNITIKQKVQLFQTTIYSLSRMQKYQILDELLTLSKIKPKQRNYSQFLYSFAFSLLTISYSAYNFVQSALPLPDIRSVYRHSCELLTVKPYMLTILAKYSK